MTPDSPDPVRALADLQAAYDRLATEAEALRLEAGDTTRALLRVIDEQRAALEDATGMAATRAAIAASNSGRLLRVMAGVRRRVRAARMHARRQKAMRAAGRRVLQVPAAVMSAPIGVNCSGYLNAESGMGEAARCALRALSRAGVPFALNNVKGPQRAADTTFTDFTTEHPHPFNLVHLNADNMAWFADERGAAYFKDRYTIGYWFWELAQFRSDWLHAFQLVDEVWVASEFSRVAIGADAPVPVVHMPLGIEAPVPGPYGRAHFGLPEAPYIFLYTFDVSSQMERKNPMGALRAFRQAGFKRHEAVLLLKFTNGHADRAAVRRLAEAASGLNVIMLDVALSRAEQNALMQCTDACLSLHRAEGFGMTIAEQMLLGRPAIATNYSGNVDFMTPDVSRLVNAPMVSLTRDYGPYLRGFSWADPDTAEAAKYMVELVRTPGLSADLGARGRAHVQRVLDPARTADLMLTRLRQIQAGQIRVEGRA